MYHIISRTRRGTGLRYPTRSVHIAVKGRRGVENTASNDCLHFQHQLSPEKMNEKLEDAYIYVDAYDIVDLLC